jgi:hypothetical protein
MPCCTPQSRPHLRNAAAWAADDERGAARRQRSALRLLIELLAVGVLQDAQGLLLAVKGLVRPHQVLYCIACCSATYLM